MYLDPAEKLAVIPEPCQLYISMGCSFVLNLQVSKRSREGWTKFVNVTAETIITDYVSPIDKSIGLITHYTGFAPLEVFLQRPAARKRYFHTCLELRCGVPLS
jgi:hypothetical protein